MPRGDDLLGLLRTLPSGGGDELRRSVSGSQGLRDSQGPARKVRPDPPRFRNDDVRFHSHLAPIPDPVSRDPLPLNTRDPSIHRHS